MRCSVCSVGSIFYAVAQCSCIVYYPPVHIGQDLVYSGNLWALRVSIPGRGVRNASDSHSSKVNNDLVSPDSLILI